MTMLAMPVVRASEMPATTAANAAGRDANAPAEGKFAAVLQQRSAAAHEESRPASKRAEARGQGRKEAASGGAVATTGAGGVAPATRPLEVATPAAGAVARVGGLADGVTDPGVEAGEAEEGGDVARQGSAVEAAGGNGGTAVAEDAVKGAAETRGEDAKGATGENSPAESAAVPASATQPLTVTMDAVPTAQMTPLDGLLGAGLSAGVASDGRGAEAATGMAGAKRGGELAPGKAPASAKFVGAAGLQQRPAVAGGSGGNAGLDGAARVDEAAAPRSGSGGRGQHESKGGARAVDRASDEEGAGRSGGNGVAEVVRPAIAGAEPVVAAAAMAVVPAHGMAGAASAPVASAAARQSDAPAVGGGARVASGAAVAGEGEVTPLTAVGAARLLRTAAGSELRVGTQSADLGAVTIRTVLGRDQMQAHISFENERMGSALSTHLATLGSALEDRLGQSLGVRASVMLSAGTDAGQNGRQGSQDGMAAQASGMGGGGGRSGANGGSGQNGQASLRGFAEGAAVADSSRPALYGGLAAGEGRLDIRV